MRADAYRDDQRPGQTKKEIAMIDNVRQMLTGQFEAALAMLNDCLQLCPSEHWDGPIAKYSFWQVAYHTLCFVDLYLSRDPANFQNPFGWRDMEDELAIRRLAREELLSYVQHCRSQAIETFAAETAESLAGPCGFPRREFSRGELHLYNLRHIQHHTGQLSAYLRRLGKEPRWIGSRWK